MSYRALEEHFRRLGHLSHAAAILQWDEAVIMPRGSGAKRAEVMATLQGLIHERLIDPRLSELTARAQEEAERGALRDAERANLREIARVVRRAQCLPASLVERTAEAQLRSEQAWRERRAENDFAGFAPLLRELLVLKREAAARLGEALGLSPYDALLDEYEPGCRSARLDELFAQLSRFLPPLIDEVIERQAGEPVRVPRGPFPIAAQKALGEAMIRAVGFDTERGRLDVSHHPFCGGAASDVRMTTRYDEQDFASALMGVLHESGHAKYEQGLPSDWEYQPVGVARSMSVHESQSLLTEMQVSRSREFLTFLRPHLARAFPEAVRRDPEAYTVDNLYRLATRVKRSKIRVDADELTYPCHIVVRYRLETALIGGTLRVEDLPDAWDAEMRALLDLSTGSDNRDGCMQDVHWPSGAFGYFPTYTLGAMTAAQLFAAAKRAISDLSAQLERGSFGALDAFLRDAVWSQASLLETDELLVRATGETLNPRYLEDHLKARYLGPT